MPLKHAATACLLVIGSGWSTGCATLQRSAIRQAGDLLAGEDAVAVFTSDDDPDLVRDALPFALKTLDVLLARDPENDTLRLSTGQLYIQYANAFLDNEADYAEAEDPQHARHLRERAARLYLRGYEHALDVLRTRHPRLRDSLLSGKMEALADLDRSDVPALFWAGAGCGGAIAARPGDMELVADLPMVEAVMRRVLELDPDFADGAVHEFFITFEGSRGEMMGGSAERARHHFEEALRLSGGRRASVYLALAESVAVDSQDATLFSDLLARALAVDVSEDPDQRLPNILSQRRARWLADHMQDLFFDLDEETP